MEGKKIRRILLEGQIEVHCNDGDIERFEKNGEMAPVEWFRQLDREFNGKYVIEIQYI